MFNPYGKFLIGIFFDDSFFEQERKQILKPGDRSIQRITTTKFFNMMLQCIEVYPSTESSTGYGDSKKVKKSF